MKFTNIYNLPSTLVKALEYSRYKRLGNISATSLVSAPRQRILEDRHSDEITQDISERIWSLIGKSVHSVLEAADVKEALQEERLSIDVDGWKLSGTSDLWEPPHTLSDYKITSVYTVLRGAKPEWEKQLNIYAHLWRKHGFPVNVLQIVAILRDWSRNKVALEKGYPKCNAMCIPIPLWPDEKIWEYIRDRVKYHRDSEVLADDKLPPCSSEEMWEYPEKWAVKKTTAKRAVRLMPSEVAAQKLLEIVQAQEPNKKFKIEYRPRIRRKCDGYCAVSDFCNQWKEFRAGNPW